jgi:hypothetical protein
MSRPKPTPQQVAEWVVDALLQVSNAPETGDQDEFLRGLVNLGSLAWYLAGPDTRYINETWNVVMKAYEK